MFVLKDIPKSRVSILKTLISVVLGAAYSAQWYADVPRLGPLAQLVYEVPETDGDDTGSSSQGTGVPVGAIRCALDPYKPPKDGSAPASSQEDTRPRVYIMVIAVLAPFRGLGAGSLLLKHIVDYARGLGAKEVYLHVRAADTDSQEWYRKRGFVETGLVQGYYRQTGGDAYIYTLNL